MTNTTTAIPLQFRMKPGVYKDDAALEGNGPSTKVHREAHKSNEEANKAYEAKKASEMAK